MKQIRVSWKGLRVKAVTIFASSNSQAAKSAKEWRNIKLSIIDSFKLSGNNVIAVLDKHSTGTLEFLVVGDTQHGSTNAYKQIELEERLYAFTYETLFHYGTPLPRLLDIKFEDDNKGSLLLKEFQIKLLNTANNYEKKAFEASFNNRYESDESLWTFDWFSEGVVLRSIDKGSEKDKRIRSTMSIVDLISSSVSTAFHWYSKEGYVFKSSMIEWSNNQTEVSSFTINFLQSDISRPEQVERFEQLISQGLSQLFPLRQHEYLWNITAFEKNLTVQLD